MLEEEVVEAAHTHTHSKVFRLQNGNNNKKKGRMNFASVPHNIHHSHFFSLSSQVFPWQNNEADIKKCKG